MTIKNKDGSNYRLKGPNPLAVNQSEWNEDVSLILHNMDWDDVELPKEEVVEKFIPTKSEVEIKQTTEEAAVEVPEAKIPEIKVAVPEVKNNARPRAKMPNSVDIWCLPAEIREYHDPLYDHVTKTIQYGDKFMFEGIVVHNDGYRMTFWTNIDTPKRGSIVYVSKNSVGDPYLERRWWKVDKVIDETEDERLKESGGFLFNCLPSVETPDFT